MTFHRFENYEARTRAVHLSTGQTRKIVGNYVFFGHVKKDAGTGSVAHYHPNDYMIFILEGKAHALCGKDRRIIMPGTLMHVPPRTPADAVMRPAEAMEGITKAPGLLRRSRPARSAEQRSS